MPLKILIALAMVNKSHGLKNEKQKCFGSPCSVLSLICRSAWYMYVCVCVCRLHAAGWLVEGGRPFCRAKRTIYGLCLKVVEHVNGRRMWVPRGAEVWQLEPSPGVSPHVVLMQISSQLEMKEGRVPV